MRLSAILVTLCCVFAPSIARAQISETFRAYAEPITIEGKLTGCSVVFDGAMQDFIYKSGGLITVSGSLILNGYVNRAVRPAVFVKFVVQDADMATSVLTPNAPTFVVPMGMDGNSVRSQFVSSVASETPGGWLGSYSFDAFVPIFDRVTKANELEFAFNRREGGKDLHFTVDLAVGRQGDQEGFDTSELFGSCVNMLLNQLEDELAE